MSRARAEARGVVPGAERRGRLEVRADGAARPCAWIRPGLRAGVLSLAILDARFAHTRFLDAPESGRARKALEEDRRWLRAKPRRRA